MSYTALPYAPLCLCCAAAALHWQCLPGDPLVKDVKTFPEKRKTVKTKAPARPVAAVLKLPKMASAFCAADGARSHALVATAFERISASASIARPSVSRSEGTRLNSGH